MRTSGVEKRDSALTRVTQNPLLDHLQYGGGKLPVLLEPGGPGGDRGEGTWWAELRGCIRGGMLLEDPIGGAQFSQEGT